MKNKPIIPVLILYLMLLSPGLVLFSGCSQAESKEIKQIVYVCTESKEIFTGVPMKVPALNPQTGNNSLQHGLYCDNCKTWHAVPPLEITGGNQVTIKCATTNIDLVAIGPVPEKTVQIKEEN
jgi:hypothetical protein